MARSQFTFTFRNATPGAAVTFSAAVYSSKADQVADGPALALDSARTVAVWADVPELTATWVDAAGTSVEAEASLAVPVVVVETGGVPGASPGTTGGSAQVPLATGDSGFSVDTTTYDNPITGEGKLTTLVLSPDNAVFAVAVEGDTYPRWLLDADPFNLGLQWGNGEVPLDGTTGCILDLDSPNGDGSMVASIKGGNQPGGKAAVLNIGTQHAHRGPTIFANRVLVVGNADASADGGISFGSGAPGFGGEVGDIYIRKDPGGSDQTIYRCTVAGAAGAATWVGIL